LEPKEELFARRTLGDIVYEAMVDVLKSPSGDRFQVITEHPAFAHSLTKTILALKCPVFARIATQQERLICNSIDGNPPCHGA
jgi:hypothetical protein